MHIIVLIISVIYALTLQGLPADLDTTFGGGAGYITFTPAAFSCNYFTALTEQADEKLVAAGIDINIAPGSSTQYSVQRFLADGTLDVTFNAGGGQPGVLVVTRVNIGSATLQLSPIVKILIDSSGRIVCVGNVLTNDATPIWKIVLFRITSAGVIDATFGAGGYTLYTNTTGGTTADGKIAVDAVFDSQERIVVAASMQENAFFTPGTARTTINRFDADGLPDGTFGVGGAVEIPLDGWIASGMTIDSTDAVYLKALKAVNTVVSPPDAEGEQGIIKALANGSLDATFGTGGLYSNVFTALPSTTIYGSGHLVGLYNNLPRILINGSSGDQTLSGVSSVFPFFFTAAGVWSNNPVGRITFTPPNVLPKYYGAVVGTATPVFAWGWWPTVSSTVSDIKVLSDGVMVVVGRGDIIFPPIDGTAGRAFVGRLTATGTVDLTFTETGGSITPPGAVYFAGTGDPGQYSAVIVRSDGKILCAGGLNQSRDGSLGNIQDGTGSGLLARYQGSPIGPPIPPEPPPTPPSPTVLFDCSEISASPLAQSIINKYARAGTQAAYCIGPVPTPVVNPCNRCNSK